MSIRRAAIKASVVACAVGLGIAGTAGFAAAQAPAGNPKPGPRPASGKWKL